MSKYKDIIRSKYYWILKGQGEIFKMLKSEVKERGDAVKLAKKIGTTSGYVSQLLNGDAEINPTWKKIVNFCLALDKVPILELKDTNEYLLEQRFKTLLKHIEYPFINESNNHKDYLTDGQLNFQLELNGMHLQFESNEINRQFESIKIEEDDFQEYVELI